MSQADSNNSSIQEQPQNTQTVPYPNPYPQQFEDNTINFYELWITLWNRKWLVIVLTVAAALGAVVYSLVTPFVYKAEALLLPPNAKDIHSINVGLVQKIFTDNQKTIHSNPILSDDVFSKFKQNLNSRTLQKKFIQENDLIELLASDRTPETRDEDIITGFTKLIKLKDVKGIFSLSIELHDAELAAQWVNDLIAFVDKETVTMLVEDLQHSIANQIRDIEYTIASKRQMAKQRRNDRIIRYEEAANIAKSMGVIDRVDSTNIVQNNQLNITTSNIPLYFRGYRALSTEISILKNRESDDPFITGLRDLQERHVLLNSIKINQEKMRTVHIDQPAYPPKSPLKPNRRLIVSLSTVLGLFLGIFLSFFIEFVQNQMKRHSE